MPELRLSPTGQLQNEVKKEIVDYLKAHPKPISPSDLTKLLRNRAEADGKVMSSISYGDTRYGFSTRYECYRSMILSLICQARVLVGPNWKIQWYEHVPKEERHLWRGGEWD